MQQRKMFKVISPVEKQGGGGQWWMRCGTAFVNKDESINVYIDALPLAGMAKNDGIKLQLREYTEVELRERAEKKATYQSRGSFDPNGLPSRSGSDGGGRGAGSGVDVEGGPIPF